jgi:hypothetical protein
MTAQLNAQPIPRIVMPTRRVTSLRNVCRSMNSCMGVFRSKSAQVVFEEAGPIAAHDLIGLGGAEPSAQ